MGCGSSLQADTAEQASRPSPLSQKEAAKTAARSAPGALEHTVVDEAMYDRSTREELIQQIGDTSLHQTIRPAGAKAPKFAVEVGDLHTYMPRDLRKAPMRFLHLEQVIAWTRLRVYESLTEDEFVSVPYSDTTDDTWQRTVLLSWRWSNGKPASNVDGFSPMSGLQIKYLKIALLVAQRANPDLKYVWIDWCCVPQYSASPMLEVARSKVFYARSNQMIVIPEIKALDPTLEILLQMVQTSLKEDPEYAGSNHAHMAGQVLSTILSNGFHAKLQYFGRVWTLAERLARCSWNEELHHWLSLNLWMGMVVDALASSSGDLRLTTSGDQMESDIYWAKLFPEKIRDNMDNVIGKLKLSLKLGNYRATGLVSEVATLLVESVAVWRSARMHEVPDKQWLAKYLESEAISIYKAWNWRDAIWSILSYFSWKDYDQSTLEGLSDAVSNLCQIAGIRPESTTVWHNIQSSETRSEELLIKRHSEELAVQLQRALPDLALVQDNTKAKEEEEAALRYTALSQARKADEDRASIAQAKKADEDRASATKAKKADEDRANAAKAKKADEDRASVAKAKKADEDRASVAKAKKADEEAHLPGRLLTACKTGDVGALDMLLKTGVSVNVRDEIGATPLSLASYNGSLQMVKAILAKGPDLEAKDVMDGETALYVAARLGHLDCVKALLEKGADTEAKDNNGWTPLARATRDANVAIVAVLLKKGANVETKNKNGETPLLVASSWGGLECVKALLEAGANVNAKNKVGKTAMDMARNKKVKELIKAHMR